MLGNLGLTNMRAAESLPMLPLLLPLQPLPLPLPLMLPFMTLMSLFERASLRDLLLEPDLVFAPPSWGLAEKDRSVGRSVGVAPLSDMASPRILRIFLGASSSCAGSNASCSGLMALPNDQDSEEVPLHSCN